MGVVEVAPADVLPAPRCVKAVEGGAGERFELDTRGAMSMQLTTDENCGCCRNLWLLTNAC